MSIAEIVAVFGIGDDARRRRDAAEQRQVDRVAGDRRFDLRDIDTSRRASSARRCAPCTSSMMSAIGKPSVRGAARRRRHVGDVRVRRAVHRAERGGAALDAAVHLAFDTEAREACCRDRSDSRRRRSSRRWCRSSAPRRRARNRVERLWITNLRGSLNSNVPLPSNVAPIACGSTSAMRSAACESRPLHSALAVLIDALPHGTLNAARIDPPDCGLITRSCPENASNVTFTGPATVRGRARGRHRACCCARPGRCAKSRAGPVIDPFDRRHAGDRHGRRRHPLDRLVEIDAALEREIERRRIEHALDVAAQERFDLRRRQARLLERRRSIRRTSSPSRTAPSSWCDRAGGTRGCREPRSCPSRRARC